MGQTMPLINRTSQKMKAFSCKSSTLDFSLLTPEITVWSEENPRFVLKRHYTGSCYYRGYYHLLIIIAYYVNDLFSPSDETLAQWADDIFDSWDTQTVGGTDPAYAITEFNDLYKKDILPADIIRFHDILTAKFVVTEHIITAAITVEAGGTFLLISVTHGSPP